MENVDVIFLAHMMRDDEGAARTDAAQLAAQRSSPCWPWEHQHSLGISCSRAEQGTVSKTVMPTPQV